MHDQESANTKFESEFLRSAYAKLLLARRLAADSGRDHVNSLRGAILSTKEALAMLENLESYRFEKRIKNANPA